MEELHNIHNYLTYDEVIGKAQSIQPYFATDLPQFSAYDYWFTSAVNTELVSGIYVGLKDFSDINLSVEIDRTKELIDTIFTAATSCYEELNDYIGHGFNEEAQAAIAFKYADFEKARPSVKRMIALFNKVHTAILQDANQTRLLAVGMPVGLPLDIANIAAELASMHKKLRILKKQHLLITRERINLYNSIWDTLSKISEAAKIIFADDPDRLIIYDLYDTEDWNVDQMEFMHLN